MNEKILGGKLNRALKKRIHTKLLNIVSHLMMSLIH